MIRPEDVEDFGAKCGDEAPEDGGEAGGCFYTSEGAGGEAEGDGDEGAVVGAGAVVVVLVEGHLEGGVVEGEAVGEVVGLGGG